MSVCAFKPPKIMASAKLAQRHGWFWCFKRCPENVTVSSDDIPTISPQNNQNKRLSRLAGSCYKYGKSVDTPCYLDEAIFHQKGTLRWYRTKRGLDRARFAVNFFLSAQIFYFHITLFTSKLLKSKNHTGPAGWIAYGRQSRARVATPRSCTNLREIPVYVQCSDEERPEGIVRVWVAAGQDLFTA